MEILCPILLVLIGLLVSQVDLMGASSPQTMDMGAIGKQIIYYGKKSDVSYDLNKYHFNGMKNITCQNFDSITGTNEKDAIKNFVEKVYDKVKDKEDSQDHEVDMMSKDYTGVYGSFLLLDNSGSNTYFIEVLNTRIRHVVPIYSYFFFKKILEVNKPGIEVNFLHYPLPLTAELEQQSDQNSNSLVILFVAIAFSLIPANFVTIIVKEKLNNSKHLMRVSGISISAYWIVNFIFELVKYYFTCVYVYYFYGHLIFIKIIYIYYILYMVHL